MKWNTSADEWEQILSQESPAAGEQEQTPRATSDGGTAVSHPTAQSTPTIGFPNGVEDIEPISAPVLEEMDQLLPPVWRADGDLEELIQWVVFAFLTETDRAEPTPTRVEAGIRYAASRAEMTTSGVAMLCTRTLYRGASETPSTQLCRDLETIENRIGTAKGT